MSKTSTLSTLKIATIALATGLASQIALADAGNAPLTQGPTRAEVQAEYQRALKAGELDFAYQVMGGAQATIQPRVVSTEQTTDATPASTQTASVAHAQ